MELEFWNAGGSGSVEATSADASVTEIAAGSGLLVPGLFDHYQSFSPRPAAFYGLPVTRKPSATMATVHGGGYIASGAVGDDRAPDPVGAARSAPDLARGRRRGADPPDRPPGAPCCGSATSCGSGTPSPGELFEHTNSVRLLAGDRFVDEVPTYRGLREQLVSDTVPHAELVAGPGSRARRPRWVRVA